MAIKVLVGNIMQTAVLVYLPNISQIKSQSNLQFRYFEEYERKVLLKHKNMASNQTVKVNDPIINVEYCGVCDYGGHCLALGQTIRKITPNATVNCARGRQGAFEVEVNDMLVYSKLKTMALPDFDEVAEVVNNVSLGEEPRLIKGEQPINCAIS